MKNNNVYSIRKRKGTVASLAIATLMSAGLIATPIQAVVLAESQEELVVSDELQEAVDKAIENQEAYVIQEEDTLELLAEAVNVHYDFEDEEEKVTGEEIAESNDIEDEDSLTPGQEVYLHIEFLRPELTDSTTATRTNSMVPRPNASQAVAVVGGENNTTPTTNTISRTTGQVNTDDDQTVSGNQTNRSSRPSSTQTPVYALTADGLMPRAAVGTATDSAPATRPIVSLPGYRLPGPVQAPVTQPVTQPVPTPPSGSQVTNPQPGVNQPTTPQPGTGQTPAPQPGSGQANTGTRSPFAQRVSDIIFDKTNELRSSLGVNPLVRATWHTEQADNRAQEQADYGYYRYIDASGQEHPHTRPDGSDWTTAFTNPEAHNENIGQRSVSPAGGFAQPGQETEQLLADALFDGWLNSAGHYRTMTSPEYVAMEVGVSEITPITTPGLPTSDLDETIIGVQVFDKVDHSQNP